MSSEAYAFLKKRHNAINTLRQNEKAARAANREAASSAAKAARNAARKAVENRLARIKKIQEMNDQAIKNLFKSAVKQTNQGSNYNKAKAAFRRMYPNHAEAQAAINRFRRTLVGSPSLHSRIGIPFRGGSLRAAQVVHGIRTARNVAQNKLRRFGNRLRVPLLGSVS